MKKLIVLLCLGVSTVLAQPNCKAYLYSGDTLKAKACEQAMQAAGHYQFSKEFQEALDSSMAIDSTFYYPYRAKSVAYLKSGDFLNWKKLIDKAVQYDPEGNLGYRAWCRYQFFRDYEGALKDIEELEALVNHDIGYSANGFYHLKIAKAVILKNLGKKQEAIEVLKEQLLAENYDPGLYDYLHLGTLYLEEGSTNNAIEALKIQNEKNDIAEGHYYLALAYKAKENNQLAESELQKAKELYLKDSKMQDTYTRPTDKIYLDWIERELKELNQ
jgi:tetratricopeptide (TPR) repeat protein